MLFDEAVERVPTHPLRFLSFWVDDSRFPAQTRSEPVGATYRSATWIVARAGVGEPVAVPAREDRAPIEDGHSASASARRADEPGAGTAKRAGCSLDQDGVSLVLPVPVASPMSALDIAKTKTRTDDEAGWTYPRRPAPGKAGYGGGRERTGRRCRTAPGSRRDSDRNGSGDDAEAGSSRSASAARRMVDLARRHDPPIKPWDPTRTPDPGGCPPLGGILPLARERESS